MIYIIKKTLYISFYDSSYSIPLGDFLKGSMLPSIWSEAMTGLQEYGLIDDQHYPVKFPLAATVPQDHPRMEQAHVYYPIRACAQIMNRNTPANGRKAIFLEVDLSTVI